MKAFLPMCLLLATATVAPASAGVYSDAMGKCLVTSSSDDDKALLVRWMFASVTLHPAVSNLSAVTAGQRLEINKQAAQLFNRLLTDSCRKETSEALKYEGAIAMQLSFQLLGQVASVSLMSDPAVSAGFAEMAKFLDEKKLKELAGKN